MDSAMRDLEQIREKDDDSEARPIALVGLLIAVTVALVFAMGSLVGWDDAEAVTADDPLARLDRSAGLAQAEPLADEDTELPDVDRSALTFPDSLGPTDERPEIAAALAAAAAELAHPDPLGHLPPMPPRVEDTLPAALPAAVVASPGSGALARTVAHDPLVASSLPVRTASPVQAGHEGEYTVQVISYDSADSAEAFAAGLRSRGHHAFVVRAEVEGRGTMWRVRIGPFETAREAQAFRRSFEETERMNTLVVRRREGEA
jgi:cell division septation protein DedD